MASVESSSPHSFLASGNIWQIWTEPMGHGSRSGEVIWHRRVLFVGETLGIRSNNISILVQIMSKWYPESSKSKWAKIGRPKSSKIHADLLWISLDFRSSPQSDDFLSPMWSPWMKKPGGWFLAVPPAPGQLPTVPLLRGVLKPS